MADKAIGELDRAQRLSEDALIPLEQQGKAMSLSGKQFADFAGRTHISNDLAFSQTLRIIFKKGKSR